MPKSIKILAPAKINLCLDVLKRTASGYHKIQTIFREIPEIYDEITIISAKNSDNLSTTCDTKFSSTKSTNPKLGKILENPAQNLAFLALRLIKKTFEKKLSKQIHKKFVHITIKKNIPISSGLGGASSDAAAVLKGLNKLWNLKLSQKKLLGLAAKLGKDVPFFIMGGTALGTNYGEKITPLPPLKNLKFKISPKSAKSATGRSPSKTRSAYTALNLKLCGKNSAKTKLLINILRNKNSQSKKQFKKILPKLFHNDFETLKLYKNLSKNHHLSGSGPSTFMARW